MLDLAATCAARVQAGNLCLHNLLPTLQNPNAPLVWKIELIRTYLLPKITYGGEILALNQTLLKQLDRPLSAAVKALIGDFSNSAYAVLCVELSIPRASACASSMRLRAVGSMPASRSVIAKLLEHPVTNNDLPARRGRRKRTWVDSGIEAAAEARADVSLLVNDIPSPKRFKHSLALLDGPLGSSYGLRATVCRVIVYTFKELSAALLPFMLLQWSTLTGPGHACPDCGSMRQFPDRRISRHPRQPTRVVLCRTLSILLPVGCPGRFLPRNAGAHAT